MPKSRPLYAAEFRRQMVELVRSGRTPEALAREFELSARAIRNWVAQAGLARLVRGVGRAIEELAGEPVPRQPPVADELALRNPKILLLFWRFTGGRSVRDRRASTATLQPIRWVYFRGPYPRSMPLKLGFLSTISVNSSGVTFHRSSLIRAFRAVLSGQGAGAGMR